MLFDSPLPSKRPTLVSLAAGASSPCQVHRPVRPERGATTVACGVSTYPSASGRAVSRVVVGAGEAAFFVFYDEGVFGGEVVEKRLYEFTGAMKWYLGEPRRGEGRRGSRAAAAAKP